MPELDSEDAAATATNATIGFDSCFFWTDSCAVVVVIHTQGWTTCASDMLIVPESTEQLAAAIKDVRAKAAAQGRPLKMRATRPGFATMHSMPCVAQPSSLSPFLVRDQKPLVVGILMNKMVGVLGIDHDKKQLRVQAQMTLKGLYETADANEMSTPRSALPWWQGLTLAGIFSTTSHGTGLNVTSMLVSLLLGLSRRHVGLVVNACFCFALRRKGGKAVGHA